MTDALELRQVSKSYGEGVSLVHALREVDLSVQIGEMVAIMGPSGSGKSTLLTIAGTLEEVTSGDVLIGGQDVSSMTRNDRARSRRRSIGYVFQDFNLLAGLTAAENVALPLELDGIRARAARVVALDALGELGLADRAGHFEFGTANHLLRFDGSDPEALNADLAAAREWFDTIDLIGLRQVAVPGYFELLEIRAQDPQGAYGAPMLELREGSYPTAAHEVAVTDGVAENLELEIRGPFVLDGTR